MKYFSIAAHNRDLVVIDGMEAFAHHFCYATKQKKGEVPEGRELGLPGEPEDIGAAPAYEIDEAAISDDDEL